MTEPPEERHISYQKETFTKQNPSPGGRVYYPARYSRKTNSPPPEGCPQGGVVIRELRIVVIRTTAFTALFTSSLAFAEPGALFLVGDYLLVGKAPDSQLTYSGKVSIRAGEQGLEVRRVIGDTSVTGIAAIEPALQGEARVLRIRFEQEGVGFEETCLWQSDLDNYARISCYLYQPQVPTRQPGLEVMFYDHTAD